MYLLNLTFTLQAVIAPENGSGVKKLGALVDYDSDSDEGSSGDDAGGDDDAGDETDDDDETHDADATVDAT